jgi:hypothetical protein
MLSKDCQQEKNETGHNEETVETQGFRTGIDYFIVALFCY